MSEELSNCIQDSNCSGNVPNTKLIYEYTESLIKIQRESLNRLDTKLSAFLAFTGVLVRFVSDFSEKITIHGLDCYSCICLTILAYICLSISALVLCLGLTAKQRGTIISPTVLMENDWYFAEHDKISDYIISAWVEAEIDYKQIGIDKAKKLNLAICLIGVSLVILIISALIKTIWGK